MYVTCSGPGPHDPPGGILGTGSVDGVWCSACVDRLLNPAGVPQPTNAEIMGKLDNLSTQFAGITDAVDELILSMLMGF